MSRRVVVADDHGPFRAMVRELLSPGYEVVGEAADGHEALTECERLRPDILLLDVQLPDLDGFEVAAILTTRGDPPAVVLTSTREEAAYRRRLATSNVRGFIHKPDLSGATMDTLLG